MKKIVVVTPYADPSFFPIYADSDFVGLDEGIELAHSASIRLSYAISSFKRVSLDNLLTYLSRDKILKYEESENPDDVYKKVCSYLFSKGWEEIVILDSFASGLNHIHELLLLLKDMKGKISIQDKNSLVTYFSKGTYVISKQGYSNFSLLGFSEANVSMEHVSKPINNLDLSMDSTHAITNTIFERVAVLKVNSGGVLLILHDNI